MTYDITIDDAKNLSLYFGEGMECVKRRAVSYRAMIKSLVRAGYTHNKTGWVLPNNAEERYVKNMTKYKKILTKNYLIQNLVFGGKTIREVARETNIPSKTVERYARLHGLEYAVVDRYIHPNESALKEQVRSMIEARNRDSDLVVEDIRNRMRQYTGDDYHLLEKMIDDYMAMKKPIRIPWLRKDMKGAGLTPSTALVSHIEDYVCAHGYQLDVTRTGKTARLFIYGD